MIEKLTVGPLQANCYLYGAEGECLVIDPGDEPQRILQAAESLGLAIRSLVCTHGHFDHTGALAELAAATEAEVLIHSADLELLLAGGLAPPGAGPDSIPAGLPAWLAEPPLLPRPARCLADGDRVPVGRAFLTVIHTPGHTPGGICLYNADEGVLFSGDTLFRLGVGRPDMPGGDGRALLTSIKERLFVLPDTTQVYPGHGSATFIGLEKARNPFVRAGN